MKAAQLAAMLMEFPNAEVHVKIDGRMYPASGASASDAEDTFLLDVNRDEWVFTRALYLAEIPIPPT